MADPQGTKLPRKVKGETGRRGFVAEDLTDRIYGKLTVLSRAETGTREIHWLCRCECGREKIILGASLRSQKTKTCGEVGCRTTKHGHLVDASNRRASPEYHSWCSIIQRCENKKNRNYPNYGARGISICARWRASFKDFSDDMGPRPRGCSIDRIDNSGNYEPGNCRWATMKVQRNNTRRNVRIAFRGETKTLAEWAEALGVNVSTLYYRVVVYKWPAEKAMTTPVIKRTSRKIPVK